MRRRYLPKTPGGKLLRLAEEAAEVSQACLKTLRMLAEGDAFDIEDALDGGNPELDPKIRESNRNWILREIKDLEHAIVVVKKAISP